MKMLLSFAPKKSSFFFLTVARALQNPPQPWEACRSSLSWGTFPEGHTCVVLAVVPTLGCAFLLCQIRGGTQRPLVPA